MLKTKMDALAKVKSVVVFKANIVSPKVIRSVKKAAKATVYGS